MPNSAQWSQEVRLEYVVTATAHYRMLFLHGTRSVVEYYDVRIAGMWCVVGAGKNRQSPRTANHQCMVCFACSGMGGTRKKCIPRQASEGEAEVGDPDEYSEDGELRHEGDPAGSRRQPGFGAVHYDGFDTTHTRRRYQFNAIQRKVLPMLP